MTEIIECAEAKRLGLKRYFTGRPCPKGHLSERRTSNWKCIACLTTEEFRERLSGYKKAYRSRHGERINREIRDRHANDPEYRKKKNATSRAWRSRNHGMRVFW